MAFCHFQENLEIDMVKNSWKLQQKQEQMLQRVFQKTAEATEDLLGNKVAGKITSVGNKTKSK